MLFEKKCMLQNSEPSERANPLARSARDSEIFGSALVSSAGSLGRRAGSASNANPVLHTFARYMHLFHHSRSEYRHVPGRFGFDSQKSRQCRTEFDTMSIDEKPGSK